MSRPVHPLAADLELARGAALEACGVVARHFRGALEVRFKDADQPVTQADLDADAVLRRRLLVERPGYGWVSEESAETAAAPGAPVWMVDPIDGTNSFVAGVPEFAVCVGLVRDGVAVLGVVANPATGVVYHAVAGGGAFRDDLPIRLRPPSARPTMVVSRSEHERGRFAHLSAWEVALCGSTAIKMCRVAEGAADGYLSYGPKNPWDVCAAEVIVREAGGVVRRRDGGPINYDTPGGWSGLVAAAPEVCAALCVPGTA